MERRLSQSGSKDMQGPSQKVLFWSHAAETLSMVEHTFILVSNVIFRWLSLRLD